MQFVDQHAEPIKNTVDAAIGVGALSSPVWLQWIENGLGLFMLFGGAALLALRIYLAIREIRDKKRD